MGRKESNQTKEKLSHRAPLHISYLNLKMDNQDAMESTTCNPRNKPQPCINILSLAGL